MQVRQLALSQHGDFNVTAPHPLQDFAWGVIREATGLEVLRFGVHEGDVLIETYQMTLHRIPVVGYGIGYIPRSVMPSDVFLKYLKGYCEQHKIIFVLFEPDEIMPEAGRKYANSLPAGRSSKENLHISSLLRVSSTPLFYRWSRIIDLTKSLDVLKSELDATTRYNVGLAERKGVVVANDDSDQGFEDFYTLYSDTTKRQRFGGHSKKYHQSIWNTFSKLGIAHILVARHGGQPLAACELWLYKNTLYYTYAGSSVEKRNLKAMNALMWHVIQYGREHGAIKLDLWGILPPGVTNPNDPWAGFSDFKKGFGGEAVEMVGSYDLVAFPVLYFVYQIAFKVRKLIQKMR